MSYTTLTQFNSPNYTPSAQVAAVFGIARSIDSITPHHWGDPNTNPSFEGVISWLCNPRSQVSAHDVATGTGRRVAILVNYYDAAWHSGNARGNATSLGIELDPRARPEDYEVGAEDIADTWKSYGRVLPLIPHRNWSATSCPGSYDINRLNSMALAIYHGTVVNRATEAQIRQAYLDILERPVDAGGLKTYLDTGWDINRIRADLNASGEKKDLEANKAAEYAKNEWVRNLKPYTNGDTKFEETVKLAVLPAAGIKRYNLENGTLVNNEVIPKGTIIDIIAKTKAQGKDYLISSYSKKNGQAVGLLASELGVPATPPVNEKPEWLKNLSDIEDKDMWARSETPVLKLADGSVVRNIPINTKVRITHATQIVGKDLLIVDGQTECIEPLYLSDTPIENPDDDLEKRVTVLESIVKMITDFLNAIFKNWKK